MVRPALRRDERSAFRDQSGLIRNDLGRVSDAPCHRDKLTRHHNDCHGVLLRADFCNHLHASQFQTSRILHDDFGCPTQLFGGI
jgi:hypothetical protein